MADVLKRLLCLFCLSVVVLPVGAVTKADYEVALDNWSLVLASYVGEGGEIDFESLAKELKHLETYIDVIARMSPTSHQAVFTSQAEVLSYHLNAYNALAMWGVIESDIPDDLDSFFKRIWFFKLRTVIVGNKSTSLYDYENDVIRAFNEPRVHFALNCMVKDCPRLPQERFYPNTLEEQLSNLTEGFFNKKKHLNIEHKHGVVNVSEILDFYTEDFVDSGNKQDLLVYINQYSVEKIPLNYEVRFINYDWTINQQR